MDHATQVALLEELQGLKDNGHFFLDDAVQMSPVSRYGSAEVFAAEQERIFRASPVIACHASELPENGSFLTMQLSGRPVLITRDRDGRVHGFLNVCRHRGTKLVDAEKGCKNAFSCPYHAWTWTNNGDLRGIPHQRPGFPDIDRAAYGLVRLPVAERLGLVWIVVDPNAAPDFNTHLAPIEAGFKWIDMAGLAVAQRDVITRKANWKLLAESGIEAYHFKVTHKTTIGPHFLDNLSSYAMLGPHMRSILPRNSVMGLKDTPKAEWQIRDHAAVLYTVFPSDQFLLMQDHVAWISGRPLAHDLTELHLVTLAPKAEIRRDMEAHWARNHQITNVTLNEDFAVNESAQAGIGSGANTALSFGRYEGALHAFNAQVEARLGE